jgi:hypothetical protein
MLVGDCVLETAPAAEKMALPAGQFRHLIGELTQNGVRSTPAISATGQPEAGFLHQFKSPRLVGTMLENPSRHSCDFRELQPASSPAARRKSLSQRSSAEATNPMPFSRNVPPSGRRLYGPEAPHSPTGLGPNRVSQPSLFSSYRSSPQLDKLCGSAADWGGSPSPSSEHDLPDVTTLSLFCPASFSDQMSAYQPKRLDWHSPPKTSRQKSRTNLSTCRLGSPVSTSPQLSPICSSRPEPIAADHRMHQLSLKGVESPLKITASPERSTPRFRPLSDTPLRRNRLVVQSSRHPSPCQSAGQCVSDPNASPGRSRLSPGFHWYHGQSPFRRPLESHSPASHSPSSS